MPRSRTALLLLVLFSTAPMSMAEENFSTGSVAFLQKYCLNCHGATKPKADLSLVKYTNDAAILADRKKWLRILDAVRDGEMPPEGKPRPTADETTAFLKSVEGIFEKADASAKPNPGRVTLRRLNRAEYNNTIRDLTGLNATDFAESFPADDVGNGFDNIGDVLTLPPVLMERYLAAAETIMAAAIMPNPPKPTVRGIGGQYLQPAGERAPRRGNSRILTYKPDGTPTETGPIFTTYDNLEPDGEFNFRSNAFVETTGKKPVKIAILASCLPGTPGAATDEEVAKLAGAGLTAFRPFVILKTLEVTARDIKKSQAIEARIPANLGLKKTAIALVKPEDGEPAPSVFIQNLGLEGPLDPRPAAHRKLLKCDPAKPKAEQTREVLQRFATRAYRRPATPNEVQRLVTMAEAAEASGDKWESAMQQVMAAVLCSPKFLFRLELDDRPTTTDPHPIDEYQLASRLSYFLWSSMPDDELFDLAARKQLTANLDAQVQRMLKDPRSGALIDNFVMQWLQLRPLRNAQPDTAQFPTFGEVLKASMFEETKLFFQTIIQEDRSILDILDADFTFLNAGLAKHYGILDTAGNKVGVKAKEKKPNGKLINRPGEWLRVSLAGTERGGILTQASVLTVTSNPTRTSPVKRGRWVLEQLLGTPPPAPPPDVPELEKDGKPVTTGSLRQRMEIHRQNPSCANCHAKMDPLGFGLENFDAVGAFRSKDGDFAIDASGELPGGLKFSGPAELKKILLARKDQFTRCLAEKMLTFAIGRGTEFFDKRAIDGIVKTTVQGDYKFSALVTAIVKSDPFRLRPGKDQP